MERQKSKALYFLKEKIAAIRKKVQHILHQKRKTTPELNANQKTRKIKKEVSLGTFISNKIGIDLGTATTVVYLDGKGAVMREPTLVATNVNTNQVIAVGHKARVMIGRTPKHIEVIQPLQQGVVGDYDVAEQLFEYIFREVQNVAGKILGPLVIIGVPCGTSQTEIGAVRDAAIDAGARKVHIVYEPFAAAVGLNVPLESEVSTMIIDVGGGTSDVMILVNGEIIAEGSIRIAGDTFDKAIMQGLRERMQLVVGSRTAEDLKIAIMSSGDERKVFSVQGRSATNGLPFEVNITSEEILSFVSPCLEEIVVYINSFIETISPEVLADLQKNPVYFVGGGPSIHTFAKRIEDAINLKVIIPERSTTVVARGTAIIANNPDRYTKYFL